MQNQTILVIYQNESFVVDYSKLHESSQKFREMMNTYLDNGVDPQKLQLRILYDRFTPRNVSNFLKMIQNKKNDVHSQEIVEICKLAKLFQVEKLYNKCMTYIHNRIDPNFIVSAEFNESNGGNYLKLEFTTDLTSPKPNTSDLITPNDAYSSTNETSTTNITNDQNNLTPTNQELHNTCYKIQVLNPPMKCLRYFFSKEGRIIFTAKKKNQMKFTSAKETTFTSATLKKN